MKYVDLQEPMFEDSHLLDSMRANVLHNPKSASVCLIKHCVAGQHYYIVCRLPEVSSDPIKCKYSEMGNIAQSLHNWHAECENQ